MNECTLGIDVGTTSIEAALVDAITFEVIQSSKHVHKARVQSNSDVNVSAEQCPKVILRTLQKCMSELNQENLRFVTRIGITGQMHGVMFWRKHADFGDLYFCNQSEENDVYQTNNSFSNLITWQDERCDSSFLDSLPPPESHLRLSSGHGCATIFWLKRNEGLSRFESYDAAGTIQDFIVYVICGLSRCVMTTQNAASWGYFDAVDNSWNVDVLSDADFPVHLLPKVVNPGHIAGTLKRDWMSIPAGVSVYAALGDTQCSFLSSNQGRSHTAVLNIGTSAQLSYESVYSKKTVGAIEYFPYFNQSYLAVAASLNGGCVLAKFVEILKGWMNQLGVSVGEDQIWEHLLESAANTETIVDDLEIIPTLFGERHRTKQTSSISGITPMNLQYLGSITRSIVKGIVGNILSMMSNKHLVKDKVDCVIINSNVINENKILLDEVQRMFSVPVLSSDFGSAAHGAALAALTNWNKNKVLKL